MPCADAWARPGWNRAGGFGIVPDFYGNGATVVMGSEMYAGQDGNVYTRTPNGWQPPSTMIGYLPPGSAASPYRARPQQAAFRYLSQFWVNLSRGLAKRVHDHQAFKTLLANAVKWAGRVP